MTHIALVGLLAALLAAASAQHPSYADYDYQDISSARQVAAAPPPSRSAYTRAVQATPRFAAQATQPRPTPVPILKQINRHNDDGSYTYGYEGADGSFKIETKLPTGEVMGKYGYVDDTGKLRVIDYGANKYGFQPAGEGITVAPPTLVDETTSKTARGGGFVDYDDESAYAVPQPRPQPRPTARPAQAPAPARSYTGFEQEIRGAPTPDYDHVPLRFAPSPAPARFAPRRPSPPRFASQVPQQQQQIPQQFAPVPQQVPQHLVQQQQASQGPVPPRPVIPNAAPVGPVYSVSPSPPPRPAPVREQYQSPGRGGSLLDQLLKQYALPSGVGQPLHDITFGSFSSQTNY